MKKQRNRKVLIISGIGALLALIIAASAAAPYFLMHATKKFNHVSEPKLTFDDGPGENTAQILDILESENITAVFFVTCTHINENESAVLKRMSDDGNIVGVHGYNHMILQSPKKIRECRDIIENITGTEPEYFRPPYGITTPTDIFAAKKYNMHFLLWSIFPKDYKADNPQEIISYVSRHLRDDSIICLHDGPSDRYNTVEALPEIIKNIKKY